MSRIAALGAETLTWSLARKSALYYIPRPRNWRVTKINPPAGIEAHPNLLKQARLPNPKPSNQKKNMTPPACLNQKRLTNQSSSAKPASPTSNPQLESHLTTHPASPRLLLQDISLKALPGSLPVAPPPDSGDSIWRGGLRGLAPIKIS